MTVAEWEALLAERGEGGEPRLIAVAGVDFLGRLFGKRFTREAFLRSVDEGFPVCSTNLTWGPDLVPIEGIELSGIHNGYPNHRLVPDPERVFSAPWWGDAILVLADVRDDAGRVIPVSPRDVLRGQAAELERTCNLTALVSVEFEFSAWRGRDWRGAVPALSAPGNYSLLAAHEAEDFFAPLREDLARAGIPVEATASEAGRGQLECTLAPAPPLTAADRASVFKAVARELARGRGMTVTFMAKPFADDAGNSGHVHVSLWRDGANVLASDGEQPTGDGMAALGGVLGLALPFCLFYAPNVNSYKRFRRGSFAPVFANWGHDNRTVAVRTVGRGTSARLELRVPGADACPHLAIAALLASIRHGVGEALHPAAAVVGDGYADGPVFARLPRTLEESLARLAASTTAGALLGEAVVAHYMRLAEAEIEASSGSVGDWERDRYWNAV